MARTLTIVRCGRLHLVQKRNELRRRSGVLGESGLLYSGDLGWEEGAMSFLDINDKVLLFLSAKSGRLEEEGTLQIWILLAYLA